MDIIDTFFLIATSGVLVFWGIIAINDIRDY